VNVPEVRRLAGAHSRAEIDQAVREFETSRGNRLGAAGANDGEVMSNLLAAQFVRVRMEGGVDLNAALREYGQRVKGILGGNSGGGGFRP